jgi:hypothetical protein
VTSFFVGHTELGAIDWRRHSVSLWNPPVRAVFASESIYEKVPCSLPRQFFADVSYLRKV